MPTESPPHCTLLLSLLLIPVGSSHGGEPVPFEQFIIDESDIAYQRAIVDLDRDGHNDVVATTTSRIRWYPAPGFNAEDLLQLSEAVHGYGEFRADDLCAADIDGDGDPDLITRIGVGNYDGIVVWFENPLPDDAITGEWVMHPIGINDYVKDIGLADFDGDGKLDVVTRELTRTQIWFANSPSHWVEIEMAHEQREGMDIGDLDGDGDPDIVLNGFWFETPSKPRSGTYQLHVIDEQWFTQSGGWQANACKVVVADIDANGDLDVLLSHSESPGYPVAWYSATDPTGAWQQHIVTDECAYCHTLLAADFNDDGIVDVMAGGMLGSPDTGLILHLADGSGAWSTQVIQDLGSYSAEIGDLDDDGDLDVISIRDWDTPPTEIWKNMLYDGETDCVGDIDGDGSTSFPDLVLLLVEFGCSGTSCVADLDGDGDTDFHDLLWLLNDFGCPDGR